MRPTLLLPLMLAIPLLAKAPLKDVPLTWSPTTEIADLGLGTLDLTAFQKRSFSVLPFADPRPRPELIAENREDEDRGTVLPVTTRDKVSELVTVQTRRLLKGLGLPVAEGRAPTVLTGEVVEFFVTERGTYVGDVRLRVQVRSGEETIWSGLAIGSAKRFGRSYQLDNYCEVLSDALLDAWAGLLKNPAFLKALAR